MSGEQVVGFLVDHGEAIVGTIVGAGATYALRFLPKGVKLQLPIAIDRDVAAAPPPPAHPKCNARRFIYSRRTEEGVESESKIYHPLCDNVSLAALTEDFARSKMPGWTLVECRDEVHFL